MCRKGENIRKRKDGRWEARIMLKDSSGKTKLKSLYAKTYSEAKDKLLNARKDNLLNNRNNYKLPKTFKEISEEWLLIQSSKHKEATILKYNTILNTHLLPYFGEISIIDINEIVINSFVSKKISSGNLKNHTALSSSYVKLIFIILNSIIDYAIAMNYRTELKRNCIAKPPITKKESCVLEVNEQLKLINYISQNITHTGVSIALALYAGLRIGEICALKWEDINIHEKTISVVHTVSRVMNSDNKSKHKTKLILDTPKTDSSQRNIPINSNLLPLLIKLKEKSTSDYVISLNKTFVSPRTLEYRYHKLLSEYSISNVNFHTLRHTFATRCVESGVDIKTLSELLGHSTVNFTLNTYVHTSIEQKRYQIEKISLLGA